MFKHFHKIILLTLIIFLISSCSPASSEPIVTPATATPQPAPTALPTTETLPTPAIETWERSYPGEADLLAGGILMAEDGGFYIVGTSLNFDSDEGGDIFLLRTDPSGELLWQASYGGEGNDEGHSMTWMEDGNLLIVGSSTSMDGTGMDTTLIEVTPDGEQLWTKTYPGPLNEHAGAIAQTPDGGYLIGGNVVDPNDIITDPGTAGYGGYEGRSNPYLLKINAAGDELWSQVYASENNLLGGGAALTADGGALFLATNIRFPEPDNQILLMKVDEAGNETWTRTWEGDILEAYDLIPTADGNYMILASITPLEGTATDQDTVLIKIDPNGKEIWRSMYGRPNLIDTGKRIVQSMDGDFVVVGERDRDLYSWETSTILFKVDANGNLVWEQTRPSTHSMFNGIFQLADGGLLYCGSRYNGRHFEVILVKTDGEGNIGE